MDRIKNGRYKDRSGNWIDITDSVQPFYVKNIIFNKYSQYKYIVKCINGLELEIPYSALTENEYKQSWQSKNKEQLIPCNILKNDLGRINIPKKSNYNLEVKSYCKTMCDSGCPALINDKNLDTYSCQYKKIKKQDYNKIVDFCKNEK